MDDFSNVNPAREMPLTSTKPQPMERPYHPKPDKVASQYNKIIVNNDSMNRYHMVKFKDIFDTDTSASASASDAESSKPNVENTKTRNLAKSNVSFSDLVVQERAKLRSSLRQTATTTRITRYNSPIPTNTNHTITHTTNTNHTTNSPRQSPTRTSSPKRMLRRSPSTIDALCGDYIPPMDDEEANDISKAITTPTHYIRTSRRIGLYPSYTRRLSDNGTIWVSDNHINYLTFNKNHLYNKFKHNRKKLARRINIMKVNPLTIDKKSWGFQNNCKSNEKNTVKNDVNCNSCNLYCSKIRTLEADLAVEKQHFEESCKTNSELKQKLNESVESIAQINKQHNHKLNTLESKIRQLTDRNMELLKRIELNINDIDYFKNCLLDSHNNLEKLQTKLTEATNENSDLTASIDHYKTENEKLIKECAYYKKQCKLLNDKLVQKSTIKLPQPQNIWPTLTHTESLVPVANPNQSVTIDTFTEVIPNDNNNNPKDMDRIPNLINMAGFDRGIFPSFVPSNSILTDTEEQPYKHNIDKLSLIDEKAAFNERDFDDKNLDDLHEDMRTKSIVNRGIEVSEYKSLELAQINPLNTSSPKNNDITYNPTTKWILDRVSRPSNLESLFKLQDRIRDMSLRM